MRLDIRLENCLHRSFHMIFFRLFSLFLLRDCIFFEMEWNGMFHSHVIIRNEKLQRGNITRLKLAYCLSNSIMQLHIHVCIQGRVIEKITSTACELFESNANTWLSTKKNGSMMQFARMKRQFFNHPDKHEIINFFFRRL